MKIKKFIRKVKTKFNRLMDAPNRKHVSPYEADVIKVFRQLIYLKGSECFVDLKTDKQYIEHEKAKLFIILSKNNVTIINDKEPTKQDICVTTYNILYDIFEFRLSRQRTIKELKYLNTVDFLNRLEIKINKNK